VEERNPNYGTHLSVLKVLVERTTGPILEIGTGYYSTPFLSSTNRELYSVEEEEKWFQFNSELFSHTIVKGLHDLPDIVWPLVFIDHGTPQEDFLLKRLKVLKVLKFDIAHIHDFQESVWDWYKERYSWIPGYKYQWFGVENVVLSNKYNVRGWLDAVQERSPA